jgi:hypothetical protein
MCASEMIVAGGAECGDVSAGVARCGANGTCVLMASDAGGPVDAGPDAGDGGEIADAGLPTRGTCLAAASAGAACDVVNGPACVLPAKCVITTDGGTVGSCAIVDPGSCH